MKTCPRCGTGYSDDLSFCLEDGMMLPASPDAAPGFQPHAGYPTVTNRNANISNPNASPPPTGALSPPPKQYKMSLFDPASRMGCIVTFGQVSAILLLVLGIGVAGLYVTFRGNSEVASSKPTAYNTASIDPSDVPANSNTSAGNHIANKAVPKPSVTKDPPKTISGGVVNGKAISLPKPPYPPAARAVRAAGAVNVEVLIDENGRVVSANAVSGHPLLRAAAAQAAREAVFNPTLLSGKPVKVSGIITYNFVP